MVTFFFLSLVLFAKENGRLLTASNGNEPTKYSMCYHDAIANNKSRKRCQFKLDGDQG